ncbi:hypothetical protein AB3K92_31800 [Burkholderia sp. Bmkn7]|uniref:hypothetical protein n=1 Tax=Burkholderia sp. Bmkn7 TaxID=3236841 RepID=UPI0034E51B91
MSTLSRFATGSTIAVGNGGIVHAAAKPGTASLRACESRSPTGATNARVSMDTIRNDGTALTPNRHVANTVAVTPATHGAPNVKPRPIVSVARSPAAVPDANVHGIAVEWSRSHRGVTIVSIDSVRSTRCRTMEIAASSTINAARSLGG